MGDIVSLLEAEYESSKSLLKANERQLVAVRDELAVAEAASAFLRVACDRVRTQLYGNFEHLVNLGLQAVFGDSIVLRFVVADKARRMHEQCRIFRKIEDRVVEVNLIDDDAGGLVDVVSFLLRLAMLVTINPPPRKFLMLDEPFKHLSAEFCPLVAEMMAQLCDRLGIQILMTTHNSLLISAADVVYRLKHGQAQLEQSGRAGRVVEDADARQGGGVGAAK